MNTDNPMFDRLPPHSNDAEMCTLGSLLLAGNDPKLFGAITSLVTGEAFYLPDHKIIFDTATAVHGKAGVVDAILVEAELRRLGLLDQIGGKRYIGELLDKVPAPSHGEHYAKIVATKARLRAIITAASKAVERAYEASDDPSDIASDTLGKLLGVSAQGIADRVVTMADAAATVRANLKSDQTRRIETGIAAFDLELGGLPVGKFSILGGRPGMGKSMVGKVMARRIARRGIAVGIVSIEEDRTKIAENSIAEASGVDNRKINANRMTPHERECVMASIGDVEALPIFIIDDVTELADVEASITTLKVRHGCEVIIVDHMHLIEVTGGPRDDGNETRKVTKISRRLKAIGKRLGIALVCCVQLNRGNEQRVERPQLKDIRESGSVEQDGDLIVLLHREDYYHRDDKGYPFDDQLEMLVRKNKDGRTATIIAKVDLKTQTIIDEPGGGSLFQPNTEIP